MAASGFDDDQTRSFTSLTAGTKVLHYKIVSKIGAGGMGEVYLAEDTKLKRQVALKFMPSHLASDAGAKARFTREAQATAKLDHPNIVTVYEVSEYQGRPFFAMLHVTGQSLKDVIKAKKLPLDQIVELGIQICEGLQKAHQSGVTHRDIKPSNIIIDSEGRAKLLDFGLATVEGTEKLTKTGSTLGTIGYMSPEQVRGEETDARSDLFSFGVVLYEMVTGRQPFRKDSEAATLHAIVSETPDPVTQFKANMPEGVQLVLDRALNKKQEKRYQHVDDCLADLNRVKSQIESGRPDGLIKVVSARLSRSRLRYMLGGAIVVGVLAVLLSLNPSSRYTVLRWLGTDRVPSAKHLVVLPFANLGEVLTSQAFCDGLMETMTSKLTQMEQFHGSLWVVPASEVRERQVVSASQARRTFGATLAVSGSVQRLNGDLRLTLNLVDTKTERQLRSSVIDDSMASVASLQDSTVIKLAEMLELQLQPQERGFLTAGGTRVREAYDFYLQARGHLVRYEKVENVDTAIGLFQQALGKDPDYALAYAGLGEAYWRKYIILTEPRWEELAIYNSQRAIELNDQVAPVYVTLGVIHEGRGRYENAIQEFHHALKLDSASHDAYRGLATAYEALNMLAQAESTYQRVIELKPDYWVGYVDLGLFYVYRGRNEDALRQLDQVVQVDHEGYDAWNNLGALYFGLERRKEARAMWERSVEIEPNFGAYSNLGALHYMENRFADAAGMYERALELDDHDYRLWINLASALYRIPRERANMLTAYDRAIQKAEEHLTINPHNPEVLSHLADCYAAIGEHAKALSFVQQALSLTPDNIDIMVTAGVVYEQLGVRDTALLWIAKALDHGFPRTQIESLPEMQSLMADPRYQRLLQTDSARPSEDMGP